MDDLSLNLDEAVCFCANALGKGMNPFVLHLAIGK